MLLDLVNELFEYEVLSPCPIETQDALQQLIKNPELGQAWFLAITEQDHTILIGHVILSYSFSLEFGGRMAIIDQIYLKPEWRNQGIGTQFFPLVEHQLHKVQTKAISLEVNIGNKDARRFYERHEFTPHRQFCVMTKRLSPTPNMTLEMVS
jgi:GNAT superfamily N-acetyltransferase